MARGKCVPLLDVLASRESLSLLRDAMDKTGPGHVTYGGERVHQDIDVVAVDRTEVAEPKLLEQHSGREEGFHALLPFAHQCRHAG